MTSHGYNIVDVPTGSAPSKRIERFEVRPGDCGENKYWSDCANDRERSELSEGRIGRRNANGSTWWYGWSLYVPASYPNVFPTKVSLGQFHQEGSHVVWMFQNPSGGLYLDNQVTGRSRQYYKLIDKEELRGFWHRIEVHARWSDSEDGFFNVWVNGFQKVAHRGRTMTAIKI